MLNNQLTKGTIKILILNILEDGSRMYGYEISKALDQRTQGKIGITEGTLYPTLHTLLKEGYVITDTENIGKRERKYYRLTEAGKDYTREMTLELLDFASTLLGFIQAKP